MKTYLGVAPFDYTYSFGDLSPEFADAFNTTAPGIVQQAQTIALPGESMIDSIARAISTLAMADAQRQLLKVQLQRANQGLPPLNTSQYGVGANVSVGVSPQVQQLLMWGGIGLLAVLVLPKVLK